MKSLIIHSLKPLIDPLFYHLFIHRLNSHLHAWKLELDAKQSSCRTIRLSFTSASSRSAAWPEVGTGSSRRVRYLSVSSTTAPRDSGMRDQSSIGRRYGHDRRIGYTAGAIGRQLIWGGGRSRLSSNPKQFNRGLALETPIRVCKNSITNWITLWIIPSFI
jgi:hypothetical protein